MLAGCGQPPAQDASSEPPVIPVSQPVQRNVTDFVDYTGRLAAINSVDIRPRVTGYLTKMPFKEGAEVKKDDLLFEIDPRPYQALVDQAEAQVNQNKARLRLAKANNITRQDRRQPANRAPSRYRNSTPTRRRNWRPTPRSSPRRPAWKLTSSTSVSARSSRLSTGSVSRYYYTLGNLVNQDQTPLTSVVSQDPIYAYFDMDERTVLMIRKRINEGKIKAPKNTTEIPVFLALEGESDFRHQGTLNFINNQVNPNTGTITVRGRFDNPKPPEGRRLLMAGMYVRIHLPIGQPHAALLVADRAIGSDQGLKFVYVVDAEHKVQYKRVTPGSLQEDGLRVVEGIEPDDWVVVGGLQQVRPRMEVEPEEIPMPTIGTGQAPPPVSSKPQPPPTKRMKEEG